MYCVSRKGTFGVVHRHYANGAGEQCVVIRWGGPLRCLTPVFLRDCMMLETSSEGEAKNRLLSWISPEHGQTFSEWSGIDTTEIRTWLDDAA